MLNLHSDYNNAVAYLQMKKVYAEEMDNLQGSYNAGNMIINLDIDSVLEECNSYWVCNQGCWSRASWMMTQCSKKTLEKSGLETKTK